MAAHQDADSSDQESEEYDPSFEKRQIARQFGCIVSLIQPTVVLKQGAKVRPSELKARLVQEHTPDIPIPRIHAYEFRFKENGIPWYGELKMDHIPGKTVRDAWAELDWESSGWFPDYWEYAQMIKFGSPVEHEWHRRMEKSKPEPWDITIIQKARRVLF